MSTRNQGLQWKAFRIYLTAGCQSIILGANDWSRSYYLAGISWSIKETAGNSVSNHEREQLKSRNSFSSYTPLPKPASTYSLSSFFRGKEWWLKGQGVLSFFFLQKTTEAIIFIYFVGKRSLKDKNLWSWQFAIRRGEMSKTQRDWIGFLKHNEGNWH